MQCIFHMNHIGDLLVAIDNNHIHIKIWTVRRDNYAQIGILTNVCVVQVPPCQMQWEQTLAI